ncbi:MAG: SH3 domain-containing protein [Anaerolineae bacterium]|nr:SH3 domain-containing protein [Anaerolineae bacterium]
MRSRYLALWTTRVFILIAIMVGSVWMTPALAQDGPDATVGTDLLNMRTGPGGEYDVIVQLSLGVELTLLAKDDIPNNGIWVWARAADSTEGWVLSDYLAIRAGLNVEALPVRPAPDVPAAPAPAEQPAEAAAPAADQFPPGTGIPAQTVSAVNFRSGPGTSYDSFGVIAEGTSALAKGRNATSDWIFAAINNQDGWVYYTFIQLSSGSIEALPVTNTVTQGTAAPVAEPVEPAAPSGANIPAPVASGPGLSGFGYGGHVSSFSRPDLMHHAGMTWVKNQVRFSPGIGGGGAASTIEHAHANGFKILFSVVGNPMGVLQPGYFEDYARYVGELAAAGPDAIEIWNEMNIDREWASGHIDPARYTELLAMAYNAIKSANPNVAVISGALAPTGAEGAFGSDRVWNDDHYLAGMAAAGAARYMDCIGAHYNEGIVPPSQTSGDPRGDYFTRFFWGMVNTYYYAFGGARPVCFTEMGYVSPEGLGPLPSGFLWGSDTTVAEQAAWLAEAVQLARSSGKVRLIIIWNVDYTNYGSDPMAGYAIIRPDGTCPACDALAAIK